MADYTSIATRFYEDAYIQTLPPTDKLLFKYLIDGPQNEPTLGIYELSLPTMAFHTGLDKESIEHTLQRFAAAHKIHWLDGWVVLKNHFKHNPLRGNQRLITGALKRLEKVPWSIRERLIDPMDTLYIPYLCPTDDLYIALEPVPIPSQSQSHTLPLPIPPPKSPRGGAQGRSAPGGGPKTGGVEKSDLEKFAEGLR